MTARAKALARLSNAVVGYHGGVATARNLFAQVANAVTSGVTWEEMQDVWVKAGHNFPPVTQLMDYATLGGFITRCDESDFRRAAQFLRVQGSALENATLIRVGVTLEKMADSYAATVKANQERTQHGRPDQSG